MKSIILTISLVLNYLGYAQDDNPIQYYQTIINYLASDSLKGRATGSAEEILAADYIYNELNSINKCKVNYQQFEIKLEDTLLNSQNVIGFINNKAQSTVLFMAHYDHLGFGGELSLSKGKHEIHNGADDNASGVALMLSMANKLVNGPKDYNYLFLACSGHEIGLYGSKYFYNHFKKKYKPVHLVINFDMVGRLNSDSSLFYDCTDNLEQSINTLNHKTPVLTKSVADRLNTLDSKWWVNSNISVITFSSGRHIDYHKTSDDIKYINFKGMATIEHWLFEWLKLIAIK